MDDHHGLQPSSSTGTKETVKESSDVRSVRMAHHIECPWSSDIELYVHRDSTGHVVQLFILQMPTMEQ